MRIPESEQQKIEFSVVTKTKGILTKRFSVKDDELVKDSGECFLQHGMVEKKKMFLSEMPEFLDGLRGNQAIIHGVIDKDMSEIVSRGVKENYPDAVTRTLDVFDYPPYGLFDIDYDPPKGVKPLSKAELIAEVRSLCPQFKEAAMIWRPSASSCITDGKDINLGIRNQRIYMPFEGTHDDLKDFVTALEMMSWEKGQGFIFISVAGTAFPRCLFDKAVFSPERLDFAAGAVCDRPLKQTLPPTEYYPGDFVDLTDYPEADPSRYKIKVDEAKSQVKPQVEEIRKEYLKKQIKVVVKKRGVATKKAKEIVQARMEKKLLPDDILYTNDYTEIIVADVLSKPEKYHGMVIRDPLEPDYGPAKAKIYCDDEGVRVNSFAHGGRIFYVNHDREHYLKWLSSLEDTDVVDVWTDGLKNFHGTNADIERIMEEVKTITGVSKAVLKKDHKDFLLREAEIEKEVSGGLSDPTHHQLAKYLINEFPMDVVGTEDMVYSYNGENCWKSTPLNQVKVRLCNKYDGLPKCCLASHYIQIVKHMYGVIQDDEFFSNVPIGISTPDYHWVVEGKKLIKKEHKAENRVRFLIPYSMADEGYKMPMFDNFLKWVFDGDQTQEDLLQEIFGGILFGVINYHYHKAILFRGGGRNGKGVVLDILKKLIPDHYISAVSPFQFNDPVYCANMAGKLVNLVSELSRNQKIPANQFKTVVDNGYTVGKRLYQQPFKFPVLAAQIFSSNYDLLTDDDSEGMRERWLILGFEQYIPQKDRIPHLGDLIVEKEGSAILRWAAEGLIRLRTKKVFTVTEANKRYHKRMFESANNMGVFINDDDVINKGDVEDPKCRVDRSGLYTVYREWCKDSGYIRADVAKKSVFNNFLEEKLGYEQQKTSKGVQWKGLQIIP